MLLNVLIVLTMFAIVYYGYRVGAFDATVTFVCIGAASLLTFMFSEDLARLVILRFFTKNEQAGLAASYWILLLVLFITFRQFAFHFLHDEKIKFNNVLYRLGGLAVGLVLAHVICGAFVVGWFIFPFAHAIPPPGEGKAVFLNTDEAYLRHIARLSKHVGPKDEDRKFNPGFYLEFKREARQKERQPEGAFTEEETDYSPSGVDPAGSLKTRQDRLDYKPE